MTNRISIFFFFALITTFKGKAQDEKDYKLYNKLYEIVIDSFLHPKPSHFVLADSTDNKRIQGFNFEKAKNPNLDPSWFTFLTYSETTKTTLPTIRVQKIKTVHAIRLFSKDSLFKIQEKNSQVGRGIIEPYGWIDGWMTISTPIISKNKDKAIIQVSAIRDELDGNGDIFLLEKKKDGKWIIIQHLRIWVS